jgi:beta-galactosidase
MADPNATPERVDHWFRLLAEHAMPLARVFIPRTEAALARLDGFFRAAERHGVGITATLGGWPGEADGAWIRAVVARYKESPALDSWILANEPGQRPEPTPAAVVGFRAWLGTKYSDIAALNAAWGAEHAAFDAIAADPGWSAGAFWSKAAPFLDWYAFWAEHLTARLAWIAEQIRAVDAVHPTHVNPHALVGNLAAMAFDLPAWRGFLNSLGASIHPAWHFPLLARDEYALGISFVSELIRGAIAPKPFWITELQGGPNTNSGGRPLCPSAEDIAQWLWTSLGAGAERVVFWLLNNRSFGVESGEWSLLDYQQQPTDRMVAAGQVARVLEQHEALLAGAEPVAAPVTILLSLESMALQERWERTQPVSSTERGVATRLEGRGRNAHVMAALGCYRALQALGIPARILHLHDFDWAAEAAGPRQMLLLPDAVALSAAQADRITAFVRAGHAALITGLTGAWDPDNRFWPLTTGWPLEGLMGANLRDIRVIEPPATVTLREPQLTLPAHLWVGEIRNESAVVMGEDEGRITAVRAGEAGAGMALWIPALVDVAAWLDDPEPLAGLLSALLEPLAADLPIRFAEYTPGCLLRLLRCGDGSYVSVVTNGTAQARTARLLVAPGLAPEPLWGAAPSGEGLVALPPRGTSVVWWR